LRSRHYPSHGLDSLDATGFADWLVEQGGLETSVSRETFAKENLASIGELWAEDR
jgi:hypothetical protein